MRKKLFKRNMVKTILCNIVRSAEYRGGSKAFMMIEQKSAEVQYKEGKQFQKSSGYTFIKVEALEELDITDDSLKC